MIWRRCSATPCATGNARRSLVRSPARADTPTVRTTRGEPEQTVGVGGMAGDQPERVRKILRALEADPRRSAAQIATMTGATEAEVAAIVRDCERSGVIRGYKTVVDWDRI